MPVAAGQHLDPAATRARILRVAEVEFYARGVDAVGVSDLAAAAGASKLSIYRHFGSKAGLVRAVAEHRSDRVHSWMSARLEDAPAGLPRIRALFDLLGEWFAEERFGGCGVVNASIDTRGAVSGTADVMREHLRRYRELLTADIVLEVPPDRVDGIARQILILIEGATIVAAFTGGSGPADDARAAAESLIRQARV